MTSCSTTEQVTLGGISYIEGDGLRTDGELIVAVESSGYNVSSLLEAMIQSIAATAQQGATGGNCYTANYDAEGVAPSTRSTRFFGWIPRLLRRLDIPLPFIEHKSITLCNTNWFATANYYNMYWHTDDVTSPSAWISADYTFHVPPEGNFLCELIDDLIDMFAIIEPEFAVEDVELEGVINFFCDEDPQDED